MTQPGPTQRRAESDRVPRLFTEALGSSGPVLVFLPGVGGTTRYWRSRVTPFAEGHRLLLVDLLGYGQSPKPWKRYTVERHVDALHGVLAGRGPFTIVGHSFGAIAALAYAARRPQDVSGLVLIGLPYFGSFERAYAYYRGLDSPDRWMLTNLVLAVISCVVTRRILGRLLPRLLKDLPREVAEDLVHHTWLSSISTIWDGVYRYNPQLDAEKLPTDIPVLMLHGDRDVTAPLEGARALVEFNPSWDLQILAGADHHPMLRHPVWCRDKIAAWMESRNSGAGANSRVESGAVTSLLPPIPLRSPGRSGD